MDRLFTYLKFLKNIGENDLLIPKIQIYEYVMMYTPLPRDHPYLKVIYERILRKRLLIQCPHIDHYMIVSIEKLDSEIQKIERYIKIKKLEL